MIYFIGCQKSVKIGFSDESIEDRFSAIQTGNPSELLILAIMPGDRSTESRLHKHFARYRLRGEWFRRSGPINDLIRSVAARNWRSLERILRTDELLEINRVLAEDDVDRVRALAINGRRRKRFNRRIEIESAKRLDALSAERPLRPPSPVGFPGGKDGDQRH